MRECRKEREEERERERGIMKIEENDKRGLGNKKKSRKETRKGKKMRKM